jgi:guanine deaminase
MDKGSFALKGIITHTPSFHEVEFHENQYVVCENGRSGGIFSGLPEKYQNIPVIDYHDKFILPGMCDMHVHAPQYAFRGMGLNLPLDSKWTTWFENYSFPEESRYRDEAYAERAYKKFADDLIHTPTTRASIFSTIHRSATEILMEILAHAGFAAYVGKLNMDRNSLPGLLETTEESLAETRTWIARTRDKYETVKPIITPRYTPSCTDACMEGLSAIVKEFHLPVQSHLSEGLDEIAWVNELKPDLSCYGEAYDMYGLFGSVTPTIMAHVVHPNDAEFELLIRRNITIAHCPQSNMNAAGGVAPVLKMLQAGIKVGLGSDMAGSNTLNLMRAMTDAIQASKLRWVFTERNGQPFAERHYLSIANVLYLATKGGGQFWGKAGSFETGYLFDAVVFDDSPLADFIPRPLHDRLDRLITQSDDRHIHAKYINGKKVL